MQVTRITRLALATLATLATVAITPAAFAQAIYGSLYGTVTDSSGAVIPNATVVVTDTSKGTSNSVQANGSGNYIVEHLIPDTYSIKVSAPGFKSFETTNINLSADTSPRIDAALTAGAAGETVSVNADEIPALKTDRADVSTIFNARNTEDLPLPNRNFTGLQLLLPGTQLLGFSHAASENPQGSQQIIVNGQHFAGVAYELDGTDNQDPLLGIIVVNPSLDSVKEAKIATQNYDAQFGKAVSAVVTAQTKSGSNAFHGGVFDFRQSDAQKAKSPFDSPDSVTGRIVPSALQNQFGGSLGGPVIKDKLFFFIDYQGIRSKVGTSTGKLNVPTDLLRSSCAAGACDFSEYVRQQNSTGIWNPATQGTARFTNNVITAADGLNPQAVALLLRLPRANTVTSTPTVNNYSGVGTGGFNYDQATARIDQQLSSRIHNFARYTYFVDTLQGGTVFGPLGGYGFGTGGFGGTSRGHNQSLAVGTDIVVTPKWVTDVRFGFFRYNIGTTKYDGGEPFANNANIPGLNTGTGNTVGAPGFYFGGGSTNNNGLGELANFGSGLNINRCNCPLTENERQLQIVNNWSHELGNHSIKFGGDVRHAYNLRVPSDANRAGDIYFTAKNTQAADKKTYASDNGLSVATFVLGQVTQFNRFASNSTNANETQERLFLYAQDTWRATNKLTINYGLRWENYFPEHAGVRGQGSILNLDTGNLQVANSGPYGANMGVKNNYNLYAPRVGVAYQPDPKTVIRAGYGRSFDIGVFGSIFGHAVTQNLPVLSKQNVNTSGYNSAFILGQAPPVPSFGGPVVNGNLRLPDGINANARPINQRFPTIDAWNAAVQRDLGKQYSLTVAYVGNKGTHTFAGDGPTTDPNQVALSANGFTFNGSNSNDPNRRAYYGRYGWTQAINYFSNHADTSFNALQTTLQKNFSQGYQFTANYAYQIAKNYNSDYFEINKKIEYGNQDDLRQSQFTIFGNFELPFGRNKPFVSNANGIVNNIIGGFELSTTANWASGLPYWPSYQNCNADRDTGPCTPNLIGSKQNGYIQSYNPVARNVRYFSPVPDITQATNDTYGRPGLATFGNVQRNSFWGPSFFNSDLALQKNFHIAESVTALFRVDAFNAFNHQSFAVPNGTVDGPVANPLSGNGGLIVGLAPGSSPRQLQFAFRARF